MEIVSVSLDAGQLSRLNAAQRKLGFGSRSGLLRAAIDSLLHENSQIDKLKGFQKAVITVGHTKRGENSAMDLIHEFEDVIETSMHQQSGEKHVEVVIAQGDARRIRELYGLLKASRGVECVNCFVL